MLSWWLAGISALIVLYLLLRFNSLWVYRLFDRALRNERTSITPAYELPRYFRLDASGNANVEIRWPGWDGWYFVVIPREVSQSAKMIRGSVMTGLYGLNGVDNYSILPHRLSPFMAIEGLFLIPVEESSFGSNEGGRGQTTENYFWHDYDSKLHLEMRIHNLETSFNTPDAGGASGVSLGGTVTGKWPNYSLHFRGTGTNVEIEAEFKFQGKDLVWWADIPGIFTYFASFGEFDGTMSVRTPGADRPASTRIQGAGAFEHGFARKPFNFDLLYSPVRIVQVFVPQFKPIRYHYELCVSNSGFHGGWMKAHGFGIDFRNRGGFYWNGEYVPIQSVKVEYSDPEYNKVFGPRGATFYRRWQVRAQTANGDLEYVACREWPAAPVASNITYFNHSFEGMYLGTPIQGSGYSEYLNI
jgi:hypothetical protein